MASSNKTRQVGLAAILSVGIFFGSYLSAHAVTTFITGQGGTGTTTPSGILYGDNGATTHLNTVTIGSNCTFSAGTLNCSGGGSGTVSTSTIPTVGQIAYWTSNGYPSLLGSVATSTLTAGSGLSGSFTQIGTGGTLSLDNTGNWAGTWQTHSPSYFQVAGTYVTSVGATYPIVSSGGTTPVISTAFASSTATINTPLSGTLTTLGSSDSLSISQANTSTNGYLSSTDWNTFNGKQNALGSLTGLIMGNAGSFYGTATSSPISLDINGNAGTATKLVTARTIAGVSFDGSANISLNNNAITNGAGYITAITGGTCTNQFARAISTAGAVTCATVANTDLANSTISGVALGGTLANLTATDGTLTFSGTYNGSTARTIGLNLGNANTWTAKQTFGNASTTQFSSGTNTFYIDSTGHITAKDTVNGWSGVVSPTHELALQIGTTTAWIATSTGAYSVNMVMPFTGTTKTVACATSAGTLDFEGTDGATSLYLLGASTTANVNTYALSFTKGDKINFVAGNPAMSPTYLYCTLTVLETP